MTTWVQDYLPGMEFLDCEFGCMPLDHGCPGCDYPDMEHTGTTCD